LSLYVWREIEAGLIESYVQGPYFGGITLFQVVNKSDMLQEGLRSFVNFVSLLMKIKFESIERYVTL